MDFIDFIYQEIVWIYYIVISILCKCLFIPMCCFQWIFLSGKKTVLFFSLFLVFCIFESIKTACLFFLYFISALFADART